MSSIPVHIRLGPAGSGKTHRARERCGERCWIVVPSEGAARFLRRGLERESAVRTFRALAQEVAGANPDDVASPALRAYFLREAVRESVTPGSYFSAAAGRPGFAPAVGDLIRELKQEEIGPAQLREATAACAPQLDDPLFAAKCESIGAIWEAYEALLLRHGTSDAEDVLGRAVKRAGIWQSRPDALVVDGFTTFTQQQVSLLAALRATGVQVEVCLTSDPERPILFARTERTLAQLAARLSPIAELREEERARHLKKDALCRLERGLFGAAEPTPCDESLQLFEAPDPVMEAEMVARAIFRLIQGGTPAERIAVVQRSLDGAGTLLKSTFARYGIDVAFHAGEPLAGNPLVSVVMALLRLFLLNWSRAEVVRCAKSSYFAVPPEQADTLERRAIARALHHGREPWFGLLRPEEREAMPEVMEWLRSLQRWQGRLERAGTPMVLAKLITQMAGELGLTARAREGDPGLAAQDDAAWRSAVSLLQEVARVSTVADGETVSFERFAGEVLAGWESGLFDVEQPLEGHVQILEAFDARQQPFDALFLMGLNERLFPRMVADDPFLRDDERQELATHGLSLPRQVELADEERILFYRAVTAPSERLILSYPRTGGDGREALPSYYLEEVRALFSADGPTTTSRTLADVVPGPDEAVGLREQVLCASAALAGHLPLAEEVVDALLASISAAAPAGFTDLKAFLAQRPGFRVQSPRLRSMLRRAADRAFSVSELETFAECPHRHFLAQQAKLREVSDEIGAAEVGSLLHAVLREFFCEARQGAGAGPADLPADSEARLAGLVDRLLEDFIKDPRPFRVEMIRYAARSYLLAFLEREREYRERTGLIPTYFELAFGPQPGYANQVTDVASRLEPLVIPGAEGEVRIAGKIDRVDLTAEGSAAVVIDYKLSHVSPLKEMLAGTSLQMPVYLLAMDRVFGKVPVAALYQPLRKGEPYWVYRPGIVPGLQPCGKGDGLPTARYEELVATAEAAISAAAGGIRAAESRPMPSDKACRFCAFTDACRHEDWRDDA